MKRHIQTIEAVLEYHPAPDAASRLRAAFDLILSKAATSADPRDRNLTENDAERIMPHDSN
jgi:hypothetical protein